VPEVKIITCSLPELTEALDQVVSKRLTAVAPPISDNPLAQLLQKPLLTPADVSALYDISVNTLAQWRVRGAGPRYVKSGSLIRYRPQDLRSYFDRCLVKTADQP
jgi:hypothetical protein